MDFTDLVISTLDKHTCQPTRFHNLPILTLFERAYKLMGTLRSSCHPIIELTSTLVEQTVKVLLHFPNLKSIPIGLNKDGGTTRKVIVVTSQSASIVFQATPPS